MIVRELFAKLGLQVDQTGFIQAEKAIGNLKNGFSAVATFMIAAKGIMLAVVKSTADYTSEIFNMNAATGISTELLQTFAYAAKTAGLELEDSQYSLGRFARAAYEASIGSSQTGYAFMRLGVQAYTSYGKVRDLNELLPETAKAIAKIENPTLRDALAMELFGRGGVKMIQALTTIGNDMEGTGKKAKELGVLLSTDVINAGKQASISFQRLSLALKGILLAIGVPLLSRITRMTEALVTWLATHRQLVALRVHEVFEHINNSLNAFLAIAKYIVEHSGLVKFFALLAAAVFAITFPLTALAILLAGIAEDLYLFFSNPKADTLTGTIVNQFKKLRTEIEKGWLEFKENPFAFLYKAAKDFFDWFVEQASKIPERIKSALQSLEPEAFKQGGSAEAFASFSERYNPLHNLIGTPDPLAWLVRQFNQPPVPYDPDKLMPAMSGGMYFHVDEVNITANSHEEGRAAGEGFVGKVNELIDQKFREAQPAVKR